MPMFSWGYRQFFIEELTELEDGSLVLPTNLIIRNNTLHSDCLKVEKTPVRLNNLAKYIQDTYDSEMKSGCMIGSEVISIPTVRFAYTYSEVLSRHGIEGQILWQG